MTPAQSTTTPALAQPRAAFRKAGRMSLGRPALANVVEMALEPLLLVGSLWAVVLASEGRVGPQHILLAVVVFSLTFPSEARLAYSPGRAIASLVIDWLAIAAVLLGFGFASGYIQEFERATLVHWAWVAPWCQLGGHFLLRAALPRLHALAGGPKRALLAGVTPASLELAQRLTQDVYCNVRLVGFVEDRGSPRLEGPAEYPRLARIEELPRVVKRDRIDLVYLALPMVSGPRLQGLLDGLRDTTASVYFVPDMFVTELIQGHVDSVSGMPVLGVCDSPFSGASGLVKRASDIVCALTIVVLISPLLALLALCVKLSSPGPVLFKQRRYGLDGEEIVVYKFRSMTVTEDGEAIRQCVRDDRRLTRLGAFMRRTSLDELPQFINVLQGRMSIVGPRPHAVAHNELYRKLIKGYMQRHKVRPGLTGWAQVNGLRGETQTLERMQARVEHDLYYLRNWSLGLDLYIMAKTVWVVLRGDNAY
jgi:putative colanic acid biosynthesis UDP-glucose lipid carrier transferase